MSDAATRSRVDNIPVPDYPTTAFTLPPKLKDARVAIVTTAGLHLPDDPGWEIDEETFRVFPASQRNLELGHLSPNFDRSGAAADLNVVYPIDRLTEMKEAGAIGDLSPVNISFMGGLRGESFSTIRMDSGPRAAKVLRDAGADVVLLTPMCPMCTRTVGVLAHTLEAEGLSTVALALVKGQVERLHPPRALFCDFPLGRALGKPLDPAFQRRVLDHAFSLLDRPSGPVLEEFPETIADQPDMPLTCSVPPALNLDEILCLDETRALRSAYDRAVAKNGRTLVGRVIDADDVISALRGFHEIACGREWNQVGLPSDIKLVIETAHDIRAYYEEAAVALADHVPAARQAEAWFYRMTVGGAAMLAAMDAIRMSEGPELLWFHLVPTSQHRLAEGAQLRYASMSHSGATK